MTREDFEDITAIPAIKHGHVRVELQHLGFCLIARRLKAGQVQEVRKIISYLEACEYQHPAKIFEVISDLLQKELDHA